MPQNVHTVAAADALNAEMQPPSTEQTGVDVPRREPLSDKERDELTAFVASVNAFVEELKAKYGKPDPLAVWYNLHMDIAFAQRRRGRVPGSPPVSADESDGSKQ